MKQSSLFILILFVSAILYSSCKEDEYMDWKILNDRWYLTLEDSLKQDTLFHKTESGLYYKVIHQGTQRHPNLKDPNNPGYSDIVKIDYNGSLIDGTVFGKDTALFYISSLVKGLQEGLPKMQGGGRYIFYIPSKLGYDTARTNAGVPPYSVLRYDINLIYSE